MEEQKKRGRKPSQKTSQNNKSKVKSEKVKNTFDPEEIEKSEQNSEENIDKVEINQSDANSLNDNSAMDSMDSLNDLNLNFSEEIPTDRINPIAEEQAKGQMPPPPPQTDYEPNQEFPEADIQNEIIEEPNYQDIPSDNTESDSYNNHKKVEFEEPPDSEPEPKKKTDRASIRKTAEAILNVYENVLPIPFKSISKFNIGKMQNMDLSGEIRMDMVVKEDGTTIESFVEDFNQQVDEIFIVTQDMKEEVREPLEDVLAEKGMALTPMQRLLIAVGSHIVAFGYQSFNLHLQNKHSMATFREFRNEEMKINKGTPPPQQPQSPPPPSPDNKKSESEKNDIKNSNYKEKNNDQEDVIIPEEINEDEITLGSYLHEKS